MCGGARPSAAEGTATVAQREAALAAATTALVLGALLLLGPAPADAPVHLYRTLLVERGAWLWDGLWLGGHAPLAGYSLLYYFPAALVGNLPLVVGACVASAWWLARLLHQEWGPAARWPTRVGAVGLAAPAFTGLYSWAVGLALALGALRLLQLERRRTFVLAAVLALACSPLAFALLALALGALWLAHRPRRRQTGVLALVIATIGLAGLAITASAGGGGTYPFHPGDFGPTLLLCAFALALGDATGRAAPIRWLVVLWGAACIVAFVVPNPLGDNLTRLRLLLLPLVLLLALLARDRPTWLRVAAVGGAFAYAVIPSLLHATERLDGQPATAAYWREPLEFLTARARPGERVEAVPGVDHWESYRVPQAGLPLARGFYRQLDMARNPELYRDDLDAAAYRAWLDRRAVRFVLLPATLLDPADGRHEAALLTSGVPGLRVAWRNDDWTIFELDRPTTPLRGPAPASLTAFGHDTIAGRVTAPGTYALDVTWTPFWRAQGACARPAPDGTTELVVDRSGSFRLSAEPSLGALGRALGIGRAPCRS